ncbi:hypothetical protein [Ornithinimicrobium sp. Y1694]|uniref:hypothetical protein n=1 Tax=Ornithinimicrobium sp. Y1694 TaxID=3418590 RepID=UPI003CEA32DE
MERSTNEFARVLDHAFTRRNLPLERVVTHLAREGAQCSASTLSLWRRGRTRPSLARSEATVVALEQVLELEDGSLMAALAEPDPGAPEWWDRLIPIHDFHDPQKAFQEFREATGMSETDGLERLRVHTRVDVGESCGVETMVHSVVLRANKGWGAADGGVFLYRQCDPRWPAGAL